DQITDCQHEAIITDDDTVARPFGPQNGRCKRIVRDFRAQLDHGIEHGIKLETEFILPRLHFFWKSPIALFCHTSCRIASASKTSGHVTRFAESVKVQTGCSFGTMTASRIGTFTSAASAASPASRYHMTVYSPRLTTARPPSHAPRKAPI